MNKFIQITLIVAEFCNLKCRYCYEKHKNGGTMDFKRAKAIIDQEFEKLAKDGFAQIEFFGGEPFLNFDLIKNVVEYCDNTYGGRCGYNSTTNGTLLTSDMKVWLAAHKDRFSLALSLDGTKEMHDANRIFAKDNSGSFDSIDKQFFLNTYKPATVKMTVAPNVIESMAEGAIQLHELGFEVDATLALGDLDWSDPKSAECLMRQFTILVDYYKEHPEVNPIRMLRLPIEALFDKEKETTRYCGAGKRIHCYTGNDDYWTPCQGFSRVTIEEDSKKYAFEEFEDYREPDGVCKRCKVNKLCSKCWGTNLAATGNIDTIDKSLCVINRITMLAGAKIIYNSLIDKTDLSESDQRRLKGAEMVVTEAFNNNNIYL